jgi:hypothetical protein
MPPLKECRNCGARTRQRTVGTPNGSCPARDAVGATHRYKVVEA